MFNYHGALQSPFSTVASAGDLDSKPNKILIKAKATNKQIECWEKGFELSSPPAGAEKDRPWRIFLSSGTDMAWQSSCLLLFTRDNK